MRNVGDFYGGRRDSANRKRNVVTGLRCQGGASARSREKGRTPFGTTACPAFQIWCGQEDSNLPRNPIQKQNQLHRSPADTFCVLTPCHTSTRTWQSTAPVGRAC